METKTTYRHIAWGAVLAATLNFSALIGNASSEVPVDLTGWVAEGGGTWTRAPDNNSVFQSVNGNPTVFHNDTNSQGQQLSGTITVETAGDDDFIGFVLGYNAGDLLNDSADYILIDWKQLDQGGFFGGVALDGLAISSVTGVLANNSGAWLHDPANNVTELQRSTNLGSTGWQDNITYDFDLTFRSDLIEVFVDGSKELSITGTFADGGFGFYNYSQANVRYAGLTQSTLPPTDPDTVIPVPASLPLLLGAIGAITGLKRRRQKS